VAATVANCKPLTVTDAFAELGMLYGFENDNSDASNEYSMKYVPATAPIVRVVRGSVVRELGNPQCADVTEVHIAVLHPTCAIDND
jgi:hypothetical protein